MQKVVILVRICETERLNQIYRNITTLFLTVKRRVYHWIHSILNYAPAWKFVVLTCEITTLAFGSFANLTLATNLFICTEQNHSSFNLWIHTLSIFHYILYLLALIYNNLTVYLIFRFTATFVTFLGLKKKRVYKIVFHWFRLYTDER